MKKLNLIYSIIAIAIILILNSCSKEDLNYYVEFYDANNISIKNDTIPVEINTTFLTTIEVQATGGNPQFFINSENITDSDEITLTLERFSEVYLQKSELEISISESDYQVGELIQVSVRYSNGNGNSRESFYLKVY